MAIINYTPAPPLASVSVLGAVVFWGVPGGGWADGSMRARFPRALNDTTGGGGIIYKAAAYHYNSPAGAQGKG